MKRTAAMLLSIVCVLSALLMTACDPSADGASGIGGGILAKPSIVNTWTGTVDKTAQFEEAFDRDLLQNVVGNVTITFQDDGRYVEQIDADSLNSSLAAALGMTVEEMQSNGYGYNGAEVRGEYSYEDSVLVLDADEAHCVLTVETLTITTDSGMVYNLTKQ